MQVRIQQLGPGMMQQIQSMCGECQGQGERIDPKLRCKKCNGRKVCRVIWNFGKKVWRNTLGSLDHVFKSVNETEILTILL